MTLADIPDADWDAVTPSGVDAVWLMGVWERSPAGLELAMANAGLLESFREALPDVRPADIIGSPYCVRRYVADERFGGPSGLATARAALAARGVRLILDYVPNHVAPDHPWVTEHPEYFIQGDDGRRQARPGGWLAVGGHVLAHGRDPYFPPWPDVVQLNAFAPGPARRDRRDAVRHRRPVRRDPLRHGHADDQRHLRQDLGRAGRARAGGGVLALRHRRSCAPGTRTPC